MAKIRSLAPGNPMARKQANNGTIMTTPDDVNTRTIKAVIDVMRKNVKSPDNKSPVPKQMV
jgi:hypothetical protein